MFPIEPVTRRDHQGIQAHAIIDHQPDRIDVDFRDTVRQLHRQHREPRCHLAERLHRQGLPTADFAEQAVHFQAAQRTHRLRRAEGRQQHHGVAQQLRVHTPEPDQHSGPELGVAGNPENHLDPLPLHHGCNQQPGTQARRHPGAGFL